LKDRLPHPTCHFGDEAGVPARLRGHRVETARLAVSVGAVAALGEGQKSESASRKREAEEDWGR
jgi:hypothetical protein